MRIRILLLRASSLWCYAVNVSYAKTCRLVRLACVVLCKPALAYQRHARQWCEDHDYSYTALLGPIPPENQAVQDAYNEQFNLGSKADADLRVAAFNQMRGKELAASAAGLRDKYGFERT